MKRLPKDVQANIRSTLDELAINPRKTRLDTKKLKGRQGYRLRVGKYRVIYDICDGELIVVVLEMGHRKDIYE